MPLDPVMSVTFEGFEHLRGWLDEWVDGAGEWDDEGSGSTGLGWGLVASFEGKIRLRFEFFGSETETETETGTETGTEANR